jgi:hypothetical protein
MSLKKTIANISLTLGSLLLLFLVMEFVVFRFVLKGSDYPHLESGGELIKYIPDQRGVFRVKDEIRAEYSINSAGWNSGHKTYVKKKGKTRIAIVGDSYVEALMVDYDKSLAERLESLAGNSLEVYRFGISGAPLSHYLYMLEHEVLRYSPDVVIFLLIHNDFDESHKRLAGVYTKSFMRLDVNGDSVTPIPPEEYHPAWYSPIRSSNTWGYLYLRERINLNLLRRLFLAPAKTEPVYEANVEVRQLEPAQGKNRMVTEYVLRRAQDICAKNGSLFLVAMDGVRSIIYQDPGRNFDYSKGALRLNGMAKDVAAELGVPFIDLHPAFSAHFKAHGKRFEFVNDGHWNELGHRVAAKSILDKLREMGAVSE